MDKLNRNILGYVCSDKAFHVCGYTGRKVMIQKTSVSYKVHSLLVQSSTKGSYFNWKGKRVYINSKAV